MSMVDRLAEKWDEWVSTNPGFPAEDCPYVDARWWLRAIADELDDITTGKIVDMENDAVWLAVANRLREETNDE